MSSRVLSYFKFDAEFTQVAYSFNTALSEMRTAKILSVEFDCHGNVKSAILDRLIHRDDEVELCFYNNKKLVSTISVFGTVASELTLTHY